MERFFCESSDIKCSPLIQDIKCWPVIQSWTNFKPLRSAAWDHCSQYMLIKIWQDITQFGLDTGPNLFCKDPQHLMCELTMVIAVSLIKHSPAKLYGPIFSHICLKTTHHKIQRSNTALIITNPIWSETGVSSWIWIWSEVAQPLFVPTLLRVFVDGQ